MSYEGHVHGVDVNRVQQRQAIHPFESGMNAAVEHDCLVSVKAWKAAING